MIVAKADSQGHCRHQWTFLSFFYALAMICNRKSWKMGKTNRPDYEKQRPCWSLHVKFYWQCNFCSVGGGGLIHEVKIPVQKLGGKEGRGLILGRIRYLSWSCVLFSPSFRDCMVHSLSGVMWSGLQSEENTGANFHIHWLRYVHLYTCYLIMLKKQPLLCVRNILLTLCVLILCRCWW